MTPKQRSTSASRADDRADSPSAVRVGALLLMALPFVLFVTPQLPWFWSVPFVIAASVFLAQELPAWRGHALLWSVLVVALALRIPWPLSLILPSLLVPALQRWLPSLHEIAYALRWGRLDAGTCLMSAAIVIVSSSALVGWFVWGGADVSDIVAIVPRWPMPLLWAGMLLFSLANAVWEELLMKWLMWDGVERLVQNRAFVVAFQGACFGLLHFYGFPRGWLGVTLAACYGVLLGLLRARSGGLLALVVTHVVADVVICLLILSRLPD